MGVIIVAATAGITTYQAYLTRKALDIAFAQQRAWLKIEPAQWGRLSVNKHGGLVLVSLKVTNVGTVPATFVGADAELYAMRVMIPRAKPVSSPDLYPMNENICRGATEAAHGRSIFPGQTQEFHVIATTPPDQKLLDKSYVGPRIGMDLIACVSYRNGVDAANHRTVESFSITDKRSSREGDNTTPWHIDSASIEFTPTAGLSEAN